MCISDWSSDVCSSDLLHRRLRPAVDRADAPGQVGGGHGGTPGSCLGIGSGGEPGKAERASTDLATGQTACHACCPGFGAGCASLPGKGPKICGTQSDFSQETVSGWPEISRLARGTACSPRRSPSRSETGCVG